MKKFASVALSLVAIVIAFAVVAIIWYLHWIAYFERFPTAPGWTFFFQK